MKNKLCTQLLFAFVSLCLSASAAFATPKDPFEKAYYQLRIRQPADKTALQKVLFTRLLPRHWFRYQEKEDLRTLRNAFYAMRNAKFRSQDLQKTFAKQPWYKPLKSAAAMKFSGFAQKNIERIRRAERQKKIVGHVLVGHWPTKLKRRGNKICLVYNDVSFLIAKHKILVKKTNAKPCKFRGAKLLFQIPKSESKDFQGYANGSFLIGELIESDNISFRLYSIQRKQLVLKGSTPNNQPFYFDAQSHFLYYDDLRFPKGCGGNIPEHKYAAYEKVCWPKVQATFPTFQSTPRPHCKCDKYMQPFVTAQKRFNPQQPKQKPTFTGKLNCNCAA